MLVETHTLARQPKEIRRVALRDQVGPQPIPHHQHHDSAASMMRLGGFLRARRRNDEQEQARKQERQASSGEHSIAHQSGPRPTVSIALQRCNPHFGFGSVADLNWRREPRCVSLCSVRLHSGLKKLLKALIHHSDQIVHVFAPPDPSRGHARPADRERRASSDLPLSQP